MARSKVTFTERGPKDGLAKLAAELGQMGSITLGVQGKEAAARHPGAHADSSLTVGEISVIHEIGLGVPKRSWLISWLNRNGPKMHRETSLALAEVLARRISRKKALAALGYRWTQQIRESIDRNEVDGPPLTAETIARKGHDIKLLETATLRNSITYKVFLPQLKSIRDVAQRRAARAK